MSQNIPPYWIGNVTPMPTPRKPLRAGPDGTAVQYGSTPDQKPLAKILPLTALKKEKDVSKP